MSESGCEKCQKSASVLSSALKTCSRCRCVRYCSVDCQRADWPHHKPECLKLSKILNSKATATIKLRDSEMSWPEEESVFFVRTTTPSLDDITISGPFYPRRTIFEQLKAKTQRVSLIGFSAAREIEEDEARLSRLESLSAPLDDHLSEIIKFDIVTIHNPTMAERLPCPAYNVITGTVLSPPISGTRNARAVPSPYPTMARMDIEGCFATPEQAKARADELTLSFKQTLSGPKIIQMPNSGIRGTLSRAITGRDEQGKVQNMTVEVKYDSGRITYT